METRERAFEEQMETLRDKVLAVTEEFQEWTRSLEGEIVFLKRAMVQWYKGARNAKDMENFLWDMEQYFIADRIPVGE